MKRIVFWLLAALILYACHDLPGPEQSPPQAWLAISDGAHGGNGHFFFLPPIVPQPTYGGTFYGSLEPVVRICVLSGDVCDVSPVAEFTTETGPGAETVHVVLEPEHYIVNWHTDRASVGEGSYRIEVYVAGSRIGFANVAVAGTAQQAAEVRRQGGVAVVAGATLPIKFRIEGDRPLVIDPSEMALLSDETERAAGVYRFEVLTGSVPEIAIGDILVGVDEGGFLRRVAGVSASGNLITAQTSQAALADIVVSGGFEGSLALEHGEGFDANQQEALVWGPARDIRAVDGVSGSASRLILDNLDLCTDLVAGVCPPGVSLTVSGGRIEFEPAVDFGADLGFFELEEFHAIATGALTLDASLALDATAAFEAEGEKVIREVAWPFVYWIPAPLPLGIPIPVVGAVHLSFVAGFTAQAEVNATIESAGFISNHVVQVGARYEDEAWSSVFELDESFEAVPASWDAEASASARFYVRPELRVVFYSAAGPFIGIEPSLSGVGDASPDNCRLRVVGALDADLGFRVQVLDYELADYSADLIGIEELLVDLACDGNGGGTGGDGELFFTAYNPSNRLAVDAYAIKPDGTGLRQLTANPPTGVRHSPRTAADCCSRTNRGWGARSACTCSTFTLRVGPCSMWRHRFPLRRQATPTSAATITARRTRRSTPHRRGRPMGEASPSRAGGAWKGQPGPSRDMSSDWLCSTSPPRR
jgi:hypothetical protein